MADVMSIVNRAVAPVARRVQLVIGRCVLKAIDDSAGMQTEKISLLEGELRKRVERMQEYGFTSHPLPGCEGVTVFVSGDRGHGIVVATDDRRHRKAGLEEGEVALYTDEGDYILLKRGQIIEVVAGSKLHVTAPETVIDAETSVTVNTGEATVNCDKALVAASTETKVDCPESILTGNLTVQGVITGQSGLAITGAPSGGGAAAQISGDVAVEGGDVIADKVSLIKHPHSQGSDSAGDSQVDTDQPTPTE